MMIFLLMVLTFNRVKMHVQEINVGVSGKCMFGDIIIKPRGRDLSLERFFFCFFLLMLGGFILLALLKEKHWVLC